MKPTKVNILGIEYDIKYVNNDIDFNIDETGTLLGNIDYSTKIIRILDNGRKFNDMTQTLIHEILHGISYALRLKLNDEENHDELDILSMALSDTFIRNDWIKFD